MSRNMGKTQTSLGCGWKAAPKIRQHEPWARVSNPRLEEGVDILLIARGGFCGKCGQLWLRACHSHVQFSSKS